jgi:hypothetical protein
MKIGSFSGHRSISESLFPRDVTVSQFSEMVAQADCQTVRPQAGLYVVDGNSLGDNVHEHIAR